MNRRITPRYAADRFIPVVFAALNGTPPLGGHLVDISADGARVIAPPNLAPLPNKGTMAELVFARSDSNRDVDLDGLRQPVELVNVRATAGARVFRLVFKGTPNVRLRAYLSRLAKLESSIQDDELPEFDPDVWAGWAAIAPSDPAR